ncbi:MAG: hypothetical protein E7665_08335 [Ruminococcaceae bacterium]|nr:hypothetical protein [Oscillospiraceae bacterium]
MNRKISIALVVILMLSLLVSCGEGNVKTEEQSPVASGTSSTAPVSTEDPNERKFIEDSLPDDIDFGGETIKIYCRTALEPHITVPEKIEDIINDAIYDRIERVKERLNIEVETVPVGANKGEAYNGVKNVIKAGSDQMDLAFLNPFGGTFNLAMEGALINLSDYTDIIDFDKPWWSEAYRQYSSLNEEANFIATGHSSQSFITFGTGLALNTTLYEDKIGDVSDLYKQILDGKWTLDAFKTMLKDSYEDLNGDGAEDENDIYGHYTTMNGLTANGLAIAFGVQYTANNEENIPELCLNSTKSVEIVDKLTELFYNTDGFYLTKEATQTAFDSRFTKFKEGTALTTFNYIQHMTQFRDMEDDYSMIPYPKYDEEQEEYRTYLSPDIAVWMIPTICDDPERAASFLEAFSSDSYNYVTPQIYETAFKEAYSRDPMMGRMLDIIVNSQYTDFGLLHSELITGLYNFLAGEVLNTSSNNFVSAYSKKEDSWNTALQGIIEQYQLSE